jgi:hypothetical protein
MAGQPQRGSRGHGRTSRRGSASATRAAVTAASRADGRSISQASRPATRSPKRPDAADQLITRSTYRLLLMRGLAPEEAAKLTAFLCGIPIADVDWSLRQVNDLLFLRQLVRVGRFGPEDGGRSRPN